MTDLPPAIAAALKAPAASSTPEAQRLASTTAPRGGSPFPRQADAQRVPAAAPTPQERVREKLASGTYAGGF